MPDNGNDYGLFIPSTQVWDVNDVNDKNRNELIVRLHQNINSAALAINNKDSGFYDTSEFVNGQTFFPNPAYTPTSVTPTNRQVYRKVINFGTLPNTGAKSVQHGIGDAAGLNASFSFTRIYGCASDPVGLTYLPIPYVSVAAGGNIELSVSGAASPNDLVTITTGSDRTMYTICYVILEYLKQ